MNSSHSYDFPSSTDDLIRPNRRRKVCLFLTPIIVVLGIITFVVIYYLPSPPIPPKVGSQTNDLRLPRSVKPISYKIDLIPHLEDAAHNYPIDGNVWIRVLCAENTKKITFHARNITINETLIDVIPASEKLTKKILILNQQLDDRKDFYTLTLAEDLQAGEEYVIFIQFQSYLRDDLLGLYRSSYVDPVKNQTIWLATTQFEPTDFRKACPSFDEPQLKAEFNISLGRMANMTSISNMRIQATELIANMPGWEWDHYEKSPPMSTYLLAFIISDFTYREAKFTSPLTGHVKSLRVWARWNVFNQTIYALDIGVKVIGFYEKYFGVEYPLPKMDIVAVPDFEDGAMENWGCIICKESEILYQPNVTAEASKDNIATTIAHELAHQWFGDLVTPSWWKDLWLNEGFASMMEYHGVDFAEPSWKKMEFFANDEIHTAFHQDVLLSSHPVSVDVVDPNQINEIFDGISYDKGASIIRMMDHFLTHKTFQHGLTAYLEKWKYNNTNQNGLWESLTERGLMDGTLPSNTTVSKIMDTWTLQSGFPVVKVDRKYGQGSAIFSQKTFRLVEDPNSNNSWWIPISYASPTHNADFFETKPEFWITNSEKSREVQIPLTDDEWFIVNIQETGCYRVNYDDRNWNLISKQLNTNSSAISVINRAQIIDDFLNLARASQLSYDVVFNLTSYLKENENEYLPWNAFFSGMPFLAHMIVENSAEGENLKSFVRDLVSKQYKTIGFQSRSSETYTDVLHRSNIIGWACFSNQSDCIRICRERFSEWVKVADPDKENPLALNIRRVIYCVVVKHGSDNIWNFLYARYLKETVESAKKEIIQGLACSQSATVLEKFANVSLGHDAEIRRQDASTVLKEIAKNRFGAKVVFDILSKRWSFVGSYVHLGLGNILRALGDTFNSKEDLEQLKSLRSANKGNLGFAARAFDETIEKVEANINWMANNFKNVAKLLNKITLK